MCHGETHHGTVREIDRTLHKTFTKGPTTNDGATVLILQGSRDDLSGRSRKLIDKHDDLTILQRTVTLSNKLGARCHTTLRVDDKITFLQELIRYLHGSLKITAAIVLQIEDEVLHALLLQSIDCRHKLLISRRSKTANTDISGSRFNHVPPIDGLDRDLIPYHGEMELFCDSTAYDGEVDLRTLGSAQPTHYLFAAHLYTRYRRVVDGNDTVAGQDTDLL